MAEMLRAAAEEMTEAADYYEGCRPGLGERFLAQLARTVLRIDRFSAAGTLWATRGIEVRQVMVKGFPYRVVYVTEPEVTIVAVAHLKRRPGYWRARVRRS